MPDDVTSAWSQRTAAHAAPQPCDSCPRRNDGICALVRSEGLQHLVSRRGYQRRTMILQAGELLQQVLMFRSGVVSVSRTLSGGRRQVVDFLMAGDDLGVSGDDEANLTVSVLEDAEICRIPRSAVLDHVRSAGFWRGLIRLVEAATERTRDHVLILGKLRAEQRVVAFLLRYRAMSRRIQSWRSRVDLPMTRRDIADHLGMAPETVCRALAWLQDRQMIVQIPDGIRILDLQELDRLGGGRFGPTSEDESSVGRLAEGSIAALA